MSPDGSESSHDVLITALDMITLLKTQKYEKLPTQIIVIAPLGKK